MRDLKLILVTFALSLILGVLIGNITKPIPECEKCVKITPDAIKQVNKKIEIETKKIKKETNEKIKEIITSPDVTVSDSILKLYARNRFGYDK